MRITTLTALGLLCVSVAAPIAHAEPSLTASSREVASEPKTYVAAGVALGADGTLDWLYSGAQIEAGYRLSTTWWLHGDVGVMGRSGYGTVQRITLMAPSADAYEARLGPEARRCNSTGAACLVGGVDLGYRTGELAGLVVAPRVGLDVGSRKLRFRPAIELQVGGPIDNREGPSIPDVGIGFTTAIAYQW
ncbi:MAG: hypothetical protein JWO36_1197 [Myxococcales bacterium]|nr:hypothetical protein [Myxococcales bacterium]